MWCPYPSAVVRKPVKTVAVLAHFSAATPLADVVPGTKHAIGFFWGGRAWCVSCNRHLWRWGRFFSKCLKWSVSSTMSLAHLSQTHLSTRSAPHITKRSPAEPVPSQTTGDSSHRSSQESGMTAPKKTESLYIKHIIRRAVKLYLSNFIMQW